jgi:hypothetical protein
MDTEEITAKGILEMLYAVPPAQRAHSEWVMSKETLDLVRALSGVDGPGPTVAGYLYGKPIRIDPEAQGIALAEEEPKRSPRKITSDRFFNALVAAGVFRDDESVRRVVIDAQAGNALVIYVERFGDTRLIEIAPVLTGLEIREVAAENAEVPA